MTGQEEVHLSDLAQRIAIRLEHVRYRSGLAVARSGITDAVRCPTAMLPDVSAAFAELVTVGYVEALMPGCSNARLAQCVPPLKREYRLTERGHTWRCDNRYRLSGLRLPTEHP